LPQVDATVGSRLNILALDIYGDLKSVDPQESQTGPQVETVSVLRLSLADSLPAHGTIGDICFGVSDPGELVSAYLNQNFTLIHLKSRIHHHLS